MRKSIVFTSTLKRAGAKPETRLFTMGVGQAKLFDSAVRSLMKDSTSSRAKVEQAVENTVAKMLGGLVPAETMPAMFHRMRQAFPILRGRDVRKLPRCGCPRGVITDVVLQIVHHGGETRTVKLHLDSDQLAFYTEAMHELIAEGATKDDAWHVLNQWIGRLLTGAEIKLGGEHEGILLRAAGLFQETPLDLIPRANEDDVRRWMFTLDRPRPSPYQGSDRGGPDVVPG